MPLNEPSTRMLGHPLDFFREHSVAPGHNLAGVMDGQMLPNGILRLFGNDADDGHLQITIHARKWAYARLVDSAQYGAGSYDLQAFAPETLSAVQRGHCFPVWFLPWKSHRVVSLRIPRPAQVNLPGGVAFPNFFFTAAINGCSVFVTGPADSPTVYHAGIDGPLPGGNAVQHWRQLFLRYANNPAVYGEVNKLDYANARRRDYNPGLVGAAGDENVGTADSQVFLQYLRQRHGQGLGIESVTPWGMVFGMRDAGTGNWTFYLQESAQISAHGFVDQRQHWWLGPLSPMHKVAGASVGRALPMVVRQFFPAPAAREQLRTVGFV